MIIVINQIITVISYAQKNIVNVQIIDISELRNMTNNLRSHYQSFDFIRFKELHSFDNLMNVKIYFTSNLVNIILEFPIPLTNQLKFVNPIPVPNSNGMIIIPEYLYMLFESTGTIRNKAKLSKNLKMLFLLISKS